MLNLVLDRWIAKTRCRALTVSVQRVGDIVLIRPRGRVSRDGGDTQLRDLILATQSRGNRRILLDLKGISFIDISGRRELVAACLAAQKRGVILRLCCLSEKVFSLFQMVELMRLFDVREDENDGLAAFAEKEVA